jgi:hypothetical protein
MSILLSLEHRLTNPNDSARGIRSRMLYISLAAVFVVASFGTAAIYLFGAAGHVEQQKLLGELAKVLMQLAAVGVVGAVVKAFLDSAQDRRRRTDQLRDQARDLAEATLDRERTRQAWLAEFRSDKLKRLIAATNKVRTARILIPAHGSARTYGEQMRELLDTALEIGLLVHETDALGPDQRNLAFTDWPSLSSRLRDMREYLEALQPEFQMHYERIAERQVVAEAAAADRPQLRAEIRRDIEQLPGIQGLLAERDANGFYGLYHLRYRDAVELIVRDTARDRLPEMTLN